MVQKKAIDIAPKYQRRERWPKEKQSALIESFLLNLPVPPIYLSEDEYGRYSIVDGKQRITAIDLFVRDQLTLSGLEEFSEIEGKKFSELPSELRNALDVRPYLRVITILKQSDSMLKFEVFIRLNRGGENMNSQELRNVAYMGRLNDLVFRLSNNTFLHRSLKIKDHKSQAFQSMQDAEMVLRFFTLSATWQNFPGNFRRDMDRFMEANMSIGEISIQGFEDRFLRAIDACQAIWGDAAFRRWDSITWRDQFLNGLFDAEMVAVDSLTDNELIKAKNNCDKILEDTKSIFSDEAFDMSIRLSTNTPSRVKYRVEKIIELLK